MPLEDQPFSELQLGVRELFRILVPGAYALLLFSVLPDARLPENITSSTAGLVGSAFFSGLVGYALRPHECWWPYSRVFWRDVEALNDEIARFAGKGEHTALYKYFLTVGQRDVSDRVHYFSSFYYMLIALSLYSALAALAEFFIPALQIARSISRRGSWFAMVIIALAVLAQLSLMLATGVASVTSASAVPKAVVRRLQQYAKGRARFVPAVLTSVAATVVASTVGVFTGRSFFSQTRATWILTLAVFAFAFANLGNKQWRSIIKEQLVHVRNSGSDIVKLAKNEGTR